MRRSCCDCWKIEWILKKSVVGENSDQLVDKGYFFGAKNAITYNFGALALGFGAVFNDGFFVGSFAGCFVGDFAKT